MTARPPIPSSLLLRRFARDQRGVSAVEFALLLPLMITLYLGGVEVTQAVSVDRKVTIVAHTVADLTAQNTIVSTAQMTSILSAATAVAAPYNAANLNVTVSSVLIDANGKATVAWSEATANAPKRSGDVTAIIPSALRVANTSLIWGEAQYTYKPAIGYVITGPLTLSDFIYMRPRLSNSVTHS
jgi:Flp pilus assembly protein TadG